MGVVMTENQFLCNSLPSQTHYIYAVPQSGCGGRRLLAMTWTWGHGE